jgi:hypothetical protein
MRVECAAKNALGYHLRSHGMSYIDYVIKHEHGGVWPLCKCGKKLEYRKGFSRFCSKKCGAIYANPMSGKKGADCPNFGQKRTEEQKKNYSEGAYKRWDIHGDSLREMMQTPEYKKAQSDAVKNAYANKNNIQIYQPSMIDELQKLDVCVDAPITKIEDSE